MLKIMRTKNTIDTKYGVRVGKSGMANKKEFSLRVIPRKTLEIKELISKSARSDLDVLFAENNDIYKGVLDSFVNTNASKPKKIKTLRNMAFELIETQINNSIPQPKITARDVEYSQLALKAEGYIQMEMDRIQSEQINDEAERGTYKHGTEVYEVFWDETKMTPVSSGEIGVKCWSIEDVYPQPGVTRSGDLEYVFTRELVSIGKLYDLYDVEVDPTSNFSDLAEVITCHYLNNDGYWSKIAWTESMVEPIYKFDSFELRRFKHCNKCDTIANEELICKTCGHNKFSLKPSKQEIITEDIVKGSPEDPDTEPIVLVKKDTAIDYYQIKKITFCF